MVIFMQSWVFIRGSGIKSKYHVKIKVEQDMRVAVPSPPLTLENLCVSNRCRAVRTQILKLFGPNSLVNRTTEGLPLAWRKVGDVTVTLTVL